MKVAVFGDSYADEIIHKDIANYKSWVEVLREKYYPDLTCYGQSASSLYFSYNLFKENHEKYDKVIFITTVPGRMTIPNYIEFPKSKFRHLMYHANGPDLVQWRLDNRSALMTEEGILAHKAMIEYYKYLYDPVYDSTINKLMRENIPRIRSDAVILNVSPSGLYEISKYESDHIGISSSELGQYSDRRMCHLSKRNNEILADKMFDWCNGVPVHIDLSDFELPSKDELVNLLTKN